MCVGSLWWSRTRLIFGDAGVPRGAVIVERQGKPERRPRGLRTVVAGSQMASGSPGYSTVDDPNGSSVRRRAWIALVTPTMPAR